MSLNFARFSLDVPLNKTQTQFFITTVRKYKRGQPAGGPGGDDQFYDLTQQLAGGILQGLTATFENTAGELFVERIRAGLVESNGTTDDGRNKYKVTIAIASDGTTQLRGLKNDEDGTSNVANVDTDNLVDQFPAKSRVKLAWASNDIQEIVNLFTANSTVTLPALAGEDIAIRRSVVKDVGEWFKYALGKTSFVGISTEVMTIGNSFSIATFGALVLGFTGLIDNGSVFSDFVVAPITASTVVLAGTGAGNVDDGSHDWKFTHTVIDVEGTHETDAGVAGSAVVVVDKSVNGKIAHSNIPVSANPNAVDTKAYRRFNGTGTYKLSYTVSNGTTVFEEDVANSALGVDIPTVNGATGLITQVASNTSLQIGKADGTSAIRINDIAAFTSQFNQNAFRTFDNGDNSKDIVHSSILQATGTRQTISSEITENSNWIIPQEGAVRRFASQDYADNAATGSGLNSLIASQVFVKGEFSYVDKPTTFIKATTAIKVGEDAGDEKASFPIVGNGVSTSSMKLALRKVATPTDNLVIRIETDDGSGDPSGTLADPNAVETIAGAGLTASFVDTSVTFAGAFTLAANTLFHVVLERSGPNDAVEFFEMGYLSPANTFFSIKKFSGAVWVLVGGKAYFSAFSGVVPQLATKTNATNGDQIDTYGAAPAAIAQFAASGWDVKGLSDTQTGMTFNEPQFLSDTPGAISETPGTILVFIGDAKSDTVIDLFPSKFPLLTFEGHKTADQSIVATPADISFAENVDIKNEFVTATFTAESSGFRRFSVHLNLLLGGITSNRRIEFEIQKNGTPVRLFAAQALHAALGTSQFEWMASATYEDYILKGDTIKVVAITNTNTVTVIGDSGSFVGDSFFHVVEYQ